MNEETYALFEAQRRKHFPTKTECQHDLKQLEGQIEQAEQQLSETKALFEASPYSTEGRRADENRRDINRHLIALNKEKSLVLELLEDAETEKEQAKRLDRELASINTDQELQRYVNKKQKKIDQQISREKFGLTFHSYARQFDMNGNAI